MAIFNSIGIVPLPVAYGGTNATTANGSGSIVLTSSPTFVTPTIGSATMTSLQFSSTSSGMIGSAAGNNASTGIVGSVVVSNIGSGSPVTFTAGVTQDLTSISVPAGDWDVFANFRISTITNGSCWISTVSATAPDPVYQSVFNINKSGGAGIIVPMQRYSLSSTTTLYLSGVVSGAALTVSGIIRARLRR